MQEVWFNVNYYESLGDIYTKYSFLNLKDNLVIDLIDDECFRFLTTKVRKQDMRHFIYDLGYDKSGDKVTIKPDNIICALWFIGIFPPNPDKVLENNRFENQKFVYTFDKKTYKLKTRRKRKK
jgi:hypothetical protein